MKKMCGRTQNHIYVCMYVHTRACVRTSSSLMMTACSSLRMLSVVMPRRSDEKGPAQAHPPMCVSECERVCQW